MLIEKAKVELLSKEDKLSAVLKYSTRVLSEFARRTEEMIEQLHTTRDKQVADK